MTNWSGNDRPERWEAELRRGLDAISDLGDEQPPDIASLQMLVADVQREQRRHLVRDLVLFWACAAVILTALLYALSRNPVYFLVLQGIAVVGTLAAGLGFLTARKRVTE
jgi:hypothetical protein